MVYILMPTHRNYRPPSDDEEDDDMDEDYEFNDESVQAFYDETNNEAEHEYRLRSQNVISTDSDREHEHDFEFDVDTDGEVPLHPEALMDIIRVDPARFPGP